MAAFGPPPGYLAAPSKRRPNFVQPLGSTSLLPAPADLRPRAFGNVVAQHLKFRRPLESGSYNVLQRVTYLVVLFLLFPLMVWTGLAMSPAITSASPAIVTVLGGHQSARTLH